MIKFDVLNRWTMRVQFTAEISCEETASLSEKNGKAIEWAYLRGADLEWAYLRRAYLRGADLRGADLEGIPVIPNIHQAVYAAASSCPTALDMSTWHICETTHCRAGWVVTLAGEDGKKLEEKIGTPAAAALIYWNSDPELKILPDFYCDNATAMADMKRLAGA